MTTRETTSSVVYLLFLLHYFDKLLFFSPISAVYSGNEQPLLRCRPRGATQIGQARTPQDVPLLRHVLLGDPGPTDLKLIVIVNGGDRLTWLRI